MPAALSHVLGNDTYNWFYQSEPEPGLNMRTIYCPRGRVLGGSSSINGMIFVRGNPADFDHWASEHGLPDWTFESCLPYFQRSETSALPDPVNRGIVGPLKLSRGDASNPLFKAWLQAGPEAGFPLTRDFNGSQQEGVGLFDRTISGGVRQSTARAYLDPVKKRSQLAVTTKALITRILFDGTRAIGVEYFHHGRLQKVSADREVILCGGAINSPQLLMLSGIGDADALAGHGIETRVNLPGVGKNLQDHLELTIQYQCKAPVSIYPATRWYRQPFVGLRWYLSKSGPGANNHFETGAFLKSSAAVAYPDLQFHFLPIAMDYDGKHQFQGHGFQVHVGPMKPTSRGEVTLRSGDPREAPRIRFNYNQSAQDQQVMRHGIRIAREIVGQAAFDEFRGVEIRPGLQVTTDSELDEFTRCFGMSAYHPGCTCKMGTDADSVVDSQGRVFGTEQLRVVDASIMPEITNGNLNAPVIMMAEKIAAGMLGDMLSE